MGPSHEDATEGRGETGRLGEVLSRGDTCGVVVCGVELSVVGDNGSEAGGSSCGVPDTGNEVEGKKAKGLLMEEGGGGQSASGCRDTTAPDLLG